MAFPTGARECQCGACHRGFTGLEAFDAHRQGLALARLHRDTKTR